LCALIFSFFSFPFTEVVVSPLPAFFFIVIVFVFIVIVFIVLIFVSSSQLSKGLPFDAFR
jgi:uncharacterized membrane protein